MYGLAQVVDDYSSKSFRLLAMAVGIIRNAAKLNLAHMTPQQVETSATNMRLLSLVVLTNNLRPDSKETIRLLQDGYACPVSVAMSRPLHAMSRPLRAMSRPLRAMSRPLHAMSRQLHAMSRPLHAMSRLLRAMSQPHRTIKPMQKKVMSHAVHGVACKHNAAISVAITHVHCYWLAAINCTAQLLAVNQHTQSDW